MSAPSLHPAVPVSLSPGTAVVTDEPVLCPDCGKTIGWQASRPWRLRCRHCRKDVSSP